MSESILWHPECSLCSDCKRQSRFARMWTKDAFSQYFCYSCWNEFIEFNGMKEDHWTSEVNSAWRNNMAFVFRTDAISRSKFV